MDDEANGELIATTLVGLAVAMTTGKLRASNIRPESSLAAAGLDVRDIEDLREKIGYRFMVFIPDSAIKPANTFNEISDFILEMVRPDSE